mmetsp:Transcript_5848/g.19668  ORF Transcript_5848/g.19668 Transcript_5848/m.19668 type:complete len:403 (+) Transcript_5848:1-1209(+)
MRDAWQAGTGMVQDAHLLEVAGSCVSKLTAVVAQDAIPPASPSVLVDLLCISADSLRECLRLCKELADDGLPLVLPPLLVQQIFHVLREHAGDSMKRRYSGEVAAREDGEEREDKLQSHISDAVGWTIKLAKAAAVEPFVQELAPLAVGLLGAEGEGVTDAKSFALCMLLDLIEYAGEAAQRFGPEVLPVLVQGIQQDLVGMGQTCVYGFGVLAQHGGAFFEPSVAPAVGVISAVLAHEVEGGGEADEEDLEEAAEVLERAKDNARSALVKVALYRPQQCRPQELLAAVLPDYPLESDAFEATESHELLLREFGAGNELLLGPGMANVPELLRIFMAVLSAVEDEQSDDPAVWEALPLSLRGRELAARIIAEFLTRAQPEVVEASVKHAAARGVGVPRCLTG